MPNIPRDTGLDSTWAFLRDPYRFISTRSKFHQSPVFQTRLILQKTLCLTGAEAARLICDPDRFVRQNAAPKRLQKTLFGQDGVQGLDGDAHRHRKALFMGVLTPANVQELAELSEVRWREYARTWRPGESIVLYEIAREILCRTVCDWAGAPIAERDVQQWTQDLAALYEHAGAIGLQHWQARKARRRLEQWAAELVESKVLDPALKTIVHIPNVNARESLKDKEREVNEIMSALGDWQGVDPTTGFHLIKAKDGRTLKVADLVDDSDPGKRSKVLGALKDPAQKNNRDNVDVIIALGMAKEGFDWIWCEHALTIGYRSSLTEIVQIIGRATRDAEGKERSRFTNLIAEPMADQAAVAEAVNDMLKAISASLLMEQVLAPRYEFTPKDTGPKEGFNYGPEGYQPGGTNLGVNETTGQFHVEINGLTTPQSTEATRICKEDLNEVVTSFLQDKTVLERGLFDKENTLPEELTQLRMGKIVRERYPDLSDVDQEAIRQHAIAAMNITQQAKLALAQADANGSDNVQGSTALLDGVRKFVNVRELDIDLIDRINPFDAAYAVLAKAMDEKSLRQVQASIAAKKVSIPEDEARELAKRALQFKNERGRLPDINSADAWEKRLAEGVAALARYRAQAKAAQGESANG